MQLTFYYLDGHTESFNVYDKTDSSESDLSIRQDIRHQLKQPWCILHLPEETVFINMGNILKVEMKPPVTQMQGEGIFSEAERLTALKRNERIL